MSAIEGYSDRLLAALAPFTPHLSQKPAASANADFGTELSGCLEAPAAGAVERQSTATVAEARQDSVAAPGARIAAALETATENGTLRPDKLASALGGIVAYTPPDWTGSPYAMPDPLRDTWLYLPSGGRINVANMMESLGRATDADARLGSLMSMMMTAEAFGRQA